MLYITVACTMNTQLSTVGYDPCTLSPNASSQKTTGETKCRTNGTEKKISRDLFLQLIISTYYQMHKQRASLHWSMDVWEPEPRWYVVQDSLLTCCWSDSSLPSSPCPIPVKGTNNTQCSHSFNQSINMSQANQRRLMAELGWVFMFTVSNVKQFCL